MVFIQMIPLTYPLLKKVIFQPLNFDNKKQTVAFEILHFRISTK